MTQKLSTHIATLALIALLGIGLIFTSTPAYAATVEYVKKSFTEGFYAGYSRQFQVSRSGAVTIGEEGSSQSFFKEGSCNLTQSAVGSFAATSSKEHYCAVSGVESGDTVIVSLPRAAGIASGAAGFIPNSAYATGTDMIGVSIYNGTGAATSSYTQATSSVRYVVFR